MVDKEQRLKEFVERLDRADRASSGEEAYELLVTTLNATEDALTGIPFDPDNWRNDGRMYPPQQDSAREVPGHPEITRYRSFKHNTWIRTNGAIRIEERESGSCLLNKPGRDGKEVWQE
jgi:hypothetical protein